MTIKSIVFVIGSVIWMGIAITGYTNSQPQGVIVGSSPSQVEQIGGDVGTILVIFSPLAFAIYYHIKIGKNKQKQKEKHTAV